MCKGLGSKPSGRGTPVARGAVWLGAVLAALAVLVAPGGASAQSSALPTFSYPNDYAGAEQPYPHEYMCQNMVKTYPFSRFPLYGSPVAGYNYTSFNAPSTNIGFVYSYDFPYAATAGISLVPLTGPQAMADVSALGDSSLVMDPGSKNPLTPGVKVMTRKRHLHLLVIPSQPGASNPGFDVTKLAPSLAAVPNRMVLPQEQQYPFLPQIRIYYSMNDYNNLGAGGPTKTFYPSIFQVDLTTGQIQPCDQLNNAAAKVFGTAWPEDAVTNPKPCVGCPPSQYFPTFSRQNPRYFTRGYGKSTLTSPPPFGTEPSAARVAARVRLASLAAVTAQVRAVAVARAGGRAGARARGRAVEVATADHAGCDEGRDRVLLPALGDASRHEQGRRQRRVRDQRGGHDPPAQGGALPGPGHADDL